MIDPDHVLRRNVLSAAIAAFYMKGRNLSYDIMNSNCENAASFLLYGTFGESKQGNTLLGQLASWFVFLNIGQCSEDFENIGTLNALREKALNGPPYSDIDEKQEDAKYLSGSQALPHLRGSTFQDEIQNEHTAILAKVAKVRKFCAVLLFMYFPINHHMLQTRSMFRANFITLETCVRTMKSEPK